MYILFYNHTIEMQIEYSFSIDFIFYRYTDGLIASTTPLHFKPNTHTLASEPPFAIACATCDSPQLLLVLMLPVRCCVVLVVGVAVTISTVKQCRTLLSTHYTHSRTHIALSVECGRLKHFYCGKQTTRRF